jgi:hypothetical protein
MRGRNELTLLSQKVIRIVAAVISTGTVILQARGSMWGYKIQALVLTLLPTENPISTTVVSIYNAKHHSRSSNSIGKERSIEQLKVRTNQKLRTQPTCATSKMSQGTGGGGRGKMHLRRHQRKGSPSERLHTVQFSHMTFSFVTKVVSQGLTEVWESAGDGRQGRHFPKSAQ